MNAASGSAGQAASAGLTAWAEVRALIKAQDLVMRYAGASKDAPPALDGVSASVRPGCITGLVGPDGAGKTTFIRLMAGLLDATQGALSVLGLDPAAQARELHERIGYMPQKFGLYEDLSVAENLRLYAEVRGLPGAERAATFDRLLGFTGLAPFTKRLAGRLSGGMKQKLGLACAMIKRPELLLLDEPSVGVDPISRRELWRMVRELADDGIGVVWSTSYLDEAEGCDEVLLLSGGRLLFSGKPAELTGRVAGRVVQVRGLSFDGASGTADGAAPGAVNAAAGAGAEHEGRGRRGVLRRALGLPGIIDGVIQGRYVRLVLGPGAAQPDLAAMRAGEQAELVTVPPRFEDAFLDILGGGPGGVSPLAARMRNKPANAGSVVEARGLTKRFGDFTAAQDITFAIRQGEIFGLLGPNGAGKSTTFKMMCGLLKPTAGQALVDGLVLGKSRGAARERIGYMAQKFSLYGTLSVRQNLDFFSGVYGLEGAVRKNAVEGMIETFGLSPHLSASADELPLGFKQRLALACAVMHEPAVLFLDEPTSGVDPITRREFWTHINGMVERGVTVMVTTHFMDEAEYCDRIALVYRGRVIALGSPDDLKDGVRTDALADPTLEDAFVTLVEKDDEATAAANAAISGAAISGAAEKGRAA
ncbi:MAG TPA: ATP-binding cassette domain-containing protein [Humidesulfovibrio sp.]|uniref:ATP-binding cassette domain-containing protein n=1 Tax=Humidesulfovibrio sp. TaxID=2910988 RepID=UPI002B85CD98|nr:ATP-binding cassette domain-containing protein [Humidesulfovibrio sp.]HWR03821.1 ATP-binding cassette domain-containing protein [Humidesulfovibrio sp.]